MNLRHLFMMAALLVIGLPTTTIYADYDGRVGVSVNHQPAPNSRLYSAARSCVTEIERHWPRQAKLVLSKRARVQEYDGDKILIVPGWVWHNGKRVSVTHECLAIPEKHVALNVSFDGTTLVASRSGLGR